MFNVVMSGESYTHVGQLSSDGLWRWDGASWRPVVPRDLPRWLNRDLKARATWFTLVAAAGVGLVADQALRIGTFGLAASLTLALIALALVFAGRISSFESRVLVGASVLFSLWMTVRASPWLLWPDLAMSLALIGLAASVTSRGSLLDLGIAEAAARSAHALVHLGFGAGFAPQPPVQARDRMGLVAPIARGALIAAPIATVLVVLLGVADPVFASFFNFNLDFGRLTLDVTLVAGGAVVAPGPLRLAAPQPPSLAGGPGCRAGSMP